MIEVIVCKAGQLLGEVWSTMKKRKLKNIPIVDAELRSIGMLNARDALELLWRRLRMKNCWYATTSCASDISSSRKAQHLGDILIVVDQDIGGSRKKGLKKSQMLQVAQLQSIQKECLRGSELGA